jgi:hypothetical protein
VFKISLDGSLSHHHLPGARPSASAGFQAGSGRIIGPVGEFLASGMASDGQVVPQRLRPMLPLVFTTAQSLLLTAAAVTGGFIRPAGSNF